jgi:hypothetical protein
MSPIWLVVVIPVLLLLVLVGGGALAGTENRTIARTARRLATERAGDTSDAFADAMARSGVPRDVSLPLYAEMARVLEVVGIYRFPARADDELRTVYGIRLFDAREEFMDTDLRDIAKGAAKRSGRRVTAEGLELGAQLAAVRTVRDLGRWLASLPQSPA